MSKNFQMLLPVQYLICLHWFLSFSICVKLLLLKTLFNIVEVWYTNLLNFDVCVVWCSDGLINRQEYKSFEIYADYQDIYDWVSPFNDSWFILILQSMGGGGEYGKSGHLYIFTSLKHLMVLLKFFLFRASFLHHITNTASIKGHAAQKLFVETLLINAFNTKTGCYISTCPIARGK